MKLSSKIKKLIIIVISISILLFLHRFVQRNEQNVIISFERKRFVLPEYFSIIIIGLIFGLIIYAFYLQTKDIYEQIEVNRRSGTLDYYQIFSQANNPIAIYDNDGLIIDKNKLFVKHFGQIKRLNEIGINQTILKNRIKKMQINERIYQLYYIQNSVQFIDLTRENRERKRLKQLDMVPCYVFLDSFNDAVSELNGVKRNIVLSEAQNLILSYFRNNGIIAELISYDRVITIMNHKDYQKLDITNNDLLEQISRIGVLHSVDITASIGIDLTRTKVTSERFDEAKEAAQIAQRRGGNQIVVKQNGSYTFIGGNNRPVEKTNDFQAKAFARRIGSLIEEATQVYIFTHSFPDMDAFASSLVMKLVVEKYNKPIKIVFDSNNVSYDVARALEMVENSHNIFIDKVDLKKINTKKSLAILVDTNNATNIHNYEGFMEIDRKIIIDHHIQKEAGLKPTINYTEVSASSTIEMIIEMIDYFGEEIELNSFETTVSLTAIMVDTKNYQMKTTAKTFAIASLLRRKGAKIELANRWINDDYKYTKYINEQVNKAIVTTSGLAFVVIESFVDRAIISKIADRLICSTEIEVGIVINKHKGIINASARSKGQINVEKIMAKFGGGGHATMAGLVIKNQKISTNELLKSIENEYENQIGVRK